MLTETEARDMLARAAATIEVPPAGPIRASSRRRRLLPALAAAAVVLVIIAGAALFSHRVSGDSATHRQHVGQQSGVPSVFGYDANAAQTMLTAHGLTVSRKPSYTCLTANRALSTEPATGTPFRPGDSVSLVVTQQPHGASCPSPARDALAWQVLDFANGRGPAPAFASKVVGYVDGRRSSMTGAQAADPTTWTAGTALGVLAAASQLSSEEGGTIPGLGVHTDNGTQSVCNGRGLPRELAGRQSLSVDIGIPPPGAGPVAECLFANLYQTDGRIDAIVVRSSRLLNDPNPPVVSNGNSDPGHPPTERELDGRWRPTGALDVDPGTGGRARPDMWLSFGYPSGGNNRFWWGAGDGCNPTAGLFTVHPNGSYTTHHDTTTASGCVGPGFTAQRTTIVDVVINATHILLNGNRLTFYSDDNRPLGAFTKVRSQ